jgi:hypothetical protein
VPRELGAQRAICLEAVCHTRDAIWRNAYKTVNLIAEYKTKHTHRMLIVGDNV